jgi:hypothetical protein
MLAEEGNGRLFSIDDAASIGELTIRFGVAQNVNRLPAARFRSESDEELTNAVVGELTTEPLQLFEADRKPLRVNEVYVSPSGTAWEHLNFPMTGYTPGVYVRYAIPYEGLTNLWQLRPHSTWDIVPRGNVEEETSTTGRLEVVVLGRGDDPMLEIESALHAELEKIRACIKEQTPFIEKANSKLRDQALVEVRKRRKRLDLIAAIGPPSPIAEDHPPTPAEPESASKIVLKPLSPQQFAAITEETFEAILAPIRAIGLGLQQCPRVVEPLGEDAIRDLFVVQLNALFGANTATGETFRRGGKTDIRVGANDFSACVSECKLWNGPGYSVDGGIDQVLKYTTPSDRHCTLLIFNKNVTLDTLMASIESALANHPRATSPPERVATGEWRMKIAREGEQSAEIVLHVFAFHYVV